MTSGLQKGFEAEASIPAQVPPNLPGVPKKKERPGPDALSEALKGEHQGLTAIEARREKSC